MTDGPNATRTGEWAIIGKDEFEYGIVNIHWDHESETAKTANAGETAAQVNAMTQVPVVVVGDFNSNCGGNSVGQMIDQAGMNLIVNGGIDCIVGRGFTGFGQTFDATPSDHPGVDAAISN
ncbi:MAG: hypothetical protein GY854_30550 [Deltaproteobacteria bacterium]|nr:hypothetical protein [Deltaproteobacteria bacterium]